MEIIDSHTHIYPQKIAQKAKEELQRAFSKTMIDLPVKDNLFKYMDEAGISRSVIACVASRPQQVVSINDWLFSIKDYRIIPFASMHPYFADYKEELKRIKDNARGIKIQSEFQLFYVDDEQAFPMYEELQKLQIPVLFHCGIELSSPGEVRSSPDRILKVITKFPELKVIGAHMGGYLLWEESLEKLAGKNIYFDTSDSISRMKTELMEKFFEKHGYDKIFYGSDFPLEVPKKETDFIKNLNISEENKEKIFSLNIKKLLDL
ncbi:MAG: amidohydrolase family protein [Endomicrobium sp.]|jgi:predicted TIM-barrel fold metal-dependent hydrolase|nr:amidohydrolase family protein [Endomicrobium sp.]